jgi:DHA2 family multidrug resistance protein
MGLTVLFIALVFMVMMVQKPKGAAPAGAGH